MRMVGCLSLLMLACTTLRTTAFVARTTTIITHRAASSLSFDPPPNGWANTTVVVGTKSDLEGLDASFYSRWGIEDGPIVRYLKSVASSGSTVSSLLSHRRLTFCVLPTELSRNNHVSHTLTQLLTKVGGGTIDIVLTTNHNPLALASAIAKAFPLYSAKTNSHKDKEIRVHYLECGAACAIVAHAVRAAAEWVDRPPNDLTTTQWSHEIQQLVNDHNNNNNNNNSIQFREIMGDQLQPYGGIAAVGQAAVEPPRLICLTYEPPSYTTTTALVGKGIVYDTGGLSLKSKAGMPGMKHDMAGAAAVLQALFAAAALQVPHKVVAIVALAENAISNQAFRNDDIITLYSNQTVEINNSDAEGRLVLADGVAHAAQHYQPDTIITMATLTGAQLITTGRRHAGILANTLALEQRAVAASRVSGDLVFPMLYCPELLMPEFDSQVADMKNSVKDRSNAQASCAGHFVEAHLPDDYEGEWLHVDMAGPGTKGQRGTGYGVGLLLSLLDVPGLEVESIS